MNLVMTEVALRARHQQEDCWLQGKKMKLACQIVILLIKRIVKSPNFITQSVTKLTARHAGAGCVTGVDQTRRTAVIAGMLAVHVATVLVHVVKETQVLFRLQMVSVVVAIAAHALKFPLAVLDDMTMTGLLRMVVKVPFVRTPVSCF